MLCFHDDLTSDMHITPPPDFISHILFFNQLWQVTITHVRLERLLTIFPQTPTLPFLGHLEWGYLVTSLMREGDPMTLPLLGNLEGCYLVASLLREEDPVTLLLLGNMGRWSHSCSGLLYEGGRSNEPPPPGHYRPKLSPRCTFPCSK